MFSIQNELKEKIANAIRKNKKDNWSDDGFEYLADYYANHCLIFKPSKSFHALKLEGLQIVSDLKKQFNVPVTFSK
jgi:hypothetical protein